MNIDNCKASYCSLFVSVHAPVLMFFYPLFCFLFSLCTLFSCGNSEVPGDLVDTRDFVTSLKLVDTLAAKRIRQELSCSDHPASCRWCGVGQMFSLASSVGSCLLALTQLPLLDQNMGIWLLVSRSDCPSVMIAPFSSLSLPSSHPITTRCAVVLGSIFFWRLAYSLSGS